MTCPAAIGRAGAGQVPENSLVILSNGTTADAVARALLGPDINDVPAVSRNRTSECPRRLRQRPEAANDALMMMEMTRAGNDAASAVQERRYRWHSFQCRVQQAFWQEQFLPVRPSHAHHDGSTMLDYISRYLQQIQDDGSIQTPDQAYKALRNLGLSDFGHVLWNCPLGGFDRLSRHLPDMAPVEVQKSWTGFSGDVLLDQSVSFVRSAAENYTALTGTTLRDKRILDYGCGYGRFLRLFRYYSDNVRGVDAWEESLALSRAAGFGDRVAKIDPVPETLPAETAFDFAFAFSVFTHLNERAATAALRAMRQVAAPGAVLCITIRPVEYWKGRYRQLGAQGENREHQARERHRATGFAFAPSGQRESDPEGCFGHATMEIDWLQGIARGWTVAATDRSANDPMQRYVYLRAA